MGFGDPYHKHPLRYVELPEEENHICSHCELPITVGWNIGCTRCDYYIHSFCNDLPQTWWHPLHDQHPLTLSTSPPRFSNNPNLCNKCRNPCLSGFTYHCQTCEFILHIKCFFTIDHVKHDHPLFFSQLPIYSHSPDCNVCGLIVEGFNFSCKDCNFIVHHDCTLIPPKVKHHHVHELTYRYDFPEECDQVYCDRCENRDGKEMDRALSYYYCKKCDYIGHVGCVTEPKEDAVLYKRFTHEHPLRLVKKPPDSITDDEVSSYNFHCDQCTFVVNESGEEFPSLIKHPRHMEHGITFHEDTNIFKCTVCDFTLGYDETLEFAHPLREKNLRFSTCNWLFRCDACGELGKGSSIGYEGEFDLHLECFALPGKLEHESHIDHPLYLYSDPKSVLFTSRNCNVCNEEMDPYLWIYCSQGGEFVAHINCVAIDLLSTFRSYIKNQPDFCAIIEPETASFEFQISKIEVPESVSMTLPPGVWDGSGSPPPFYRKSEILIDRKRDDGEENCGIDLEGLEELGDELHCPKCNILISTQAKYSYIDDWESDNFEYYMRNTVTSVNYQSLSPSELLVLLSEQKIDKLYCPICNLLIFPPTYSCDLCQIFFHKSCAELPRKCPSVGELFYVLVAPPFFNNLSICSNCNYTITGYAYLLSTSDVILDVQCALRAPLVQRMNHEHRVFSRRLKQGTLMCRACGNCILEGTVLIGCPRKYCKFYLHLECALLQPIIKHRIHKHPLEIATDLAELDDNYICDACEKDLNPYLWAYRCLDNCGGYATSHVTCVITSIKKCHFRYDQECQNMTEEQKLEFLKKAKARGTR